MKRHLVRILDWVALAIWAGNIGLQLWQQIAGTGGLNKLIPTPVWLIATIYVLFRFAIPLFIGRGQPRGEIPRPAGPPVAEGACSGRIGLVRFNGPFLQVSVYPDRFVILVTLLGEHTIMGHDIDSVADDPRWPGRVLAIHHTAAGTRSPIRLWLREDDPIRRAIEGMHLGTRPDAEGIWWEE